MVAVALIVGSVLAAFITVAAGTSQAVAPLVILYLGTTFAMFALLPALVFGTLALQALHLLKVNLWVGTTIMGAGGAAVGALLMTITFTGFEPWGAIAGGSIGLMQGILLHRHRQAGATPASS